MQVHVRGLKLRGLARTTYLSAMSQASRARRISTFLFAVGGAALVAHCSAGGSKSDGDAGAGPAEGTEGGPCYGNKTCNAGLLCASDLCVALPGSGGGSGKGGAPSGGTTGTGGSSGASSGGTTGTGGGCGGKVYVAKQAPAAMLVVLDRSKSMAGGKWQAASNALVQALDQTVFESMSVGVLAAPSQGNVAGPACILGLPVPCQAPTSPQVPITDVGSKPSADPSGFRGQLKQWLSTGGPTGGPLDPDASPLYAATQSALNALKAWPKEGKRILLIVSDGSISCNQLSARPGFSDCNGCDHDWEDPNNLVQLVGAANGDAQTPVQTFVVGVPGADTYDAAGCTYPPYHMRAALSAIAYAGAPKYVNPACTGTAFTKGSPDPTVSCHFDMTAGAFGGAELASNISKIRAKALGCTFELPEPAPGETLNLSQVNVQINLGAGPVSVPRRSDKADPCAADYCWDYDANTKVELIGKACDDLTNASSAGVSIVAGCDTIIK